MDNVRIFIFDHDIVAARSADEARQCMMGASGDKYDPDEGWPNSETALDAEITIDANIDGKGCKCPNCGCEFTRTTFREMVEGVQIPAIIGGLD